MDTTSKAYLVGGLKVTAENGWFAAQPSGAEDIYRIYAESLRGADHLRRIIIYAVSRRKHTVVNAAFAPVRTIDPDSKSAGTVK